MAVNRPSKVGAVCYLSIDHSLEGSVTVCTILIVNDFPAPTAFVIQTHLDPEQTVILTVKALLKSLLYLELTF